MKIKQISEDLRAMAQRNKWIVCSVTQIGRQNFNSTDMSLTDISEKLSLSVTTISTYRTRVMKKLNLKSNADLTLYAIEHKII